MKPFRFRLEKLLNIRQQQTKLAQNNLAQAQMRTRQTEALLAAAQAERLASEEALLAKRQRRMTALQWQLSTQLHEALIEREREAEAALAAARQHEEAKRAELAEAERKQKTLERLKERQFEEYRYAMEAWEQAQIDEMAQNIYREGGGLR